MQFTGFRIPFEFRLMFQQRTIAIDDKFPEHKKIKLFANFWSNYFLVLIY